jgi:hypothetical protein
MASYTENYALTKPTMAESADIRVINSNMDTVDDVMHSTQVSLAPAYDMTETYNTGDVVMYELLMYECLEDEVTGTWDATKWQRTTAGEHGGGSDVEVTQIQTEGKAVASIAVDGVSTDILVPELKVYGEASGDLITIDDAMEAPLEECKVTLEPQQDLHGYDSPWVGGAGKNKLNLNTNVTVLSGSVPSAVTITSSEGTATITEAYYNRTANKFGWAFEVEANQVYSLSFDAQSTDAILIKIYDSNGDLVYNTTTSAAEGISRQFTPTASGTLYFYASISTWGQTIKLTKVQIESGSQPTTYAPYSNECPISGWDECKVQRTGKNLWGGEKLADDIVAKVPNATKNTTNKTVTYVSSQVANKVLFDNFKGNTQYTFYMSTENSFTNLRVWYSDETNEIIQPNTVVVSRSGKTIDRLAGVYSSGSTALKYEECGIF